ncbi:hypothetical protein [Hyalangium versicolor]|uniref:hypothetical protein n=1 Tax=Hyalangium versicolor TaxID=2861190 RepID=UPI001CCF337C|nr:hypothetical protein [Hyalangium versicolor]
MKLNKAASPQAVLPKQTSPSAPAKASNASAKNPLTAQRKDAFSTQGRSSPVDLSGKPQTLAHAGPTFKLSQLATAGKADTAGKANAAGKTSEVQKPQGITGKERAEQDVNVQTVAKDRTNIEETQTALKKEVTQSADDILAMAEGKKSVPEGAKVKKISDTEAELVRVDKDGNTVERTVAKRGKDGYASLDTTKHQDGVTTRDHTESLEDGSTRVRHAQWQGEVKEVTQPPSFEDIEHSRDPKYSMTDNRVGQLDDQGHWVKEGGKFSVDEYSQSEGAVKLSTTQYTTQRGEEGLDEKLGGPFKDDQDIDRATTHSYFMPAPVDGKQEPGEYRRTERFSQGDVQATSFVDGKLDADQEHFTALVTTGAPGNLPPEKHVDYKEVAGTQPHSREDIVKVRDAHNDFWGGDFDANDNQSSGTMPKRWLVEVKKSPESYRSQTFVEGAPNATLTTERTLKPDNTIEERYEGKTFSQDGKNLVDVKGSTQSQYGDDGKLKSLHSDVLAPDGTIQQNSYSREPDGKEGQFKEHYESKTFEPDKADPTTTSKMDRYTEVTPDGAEKELRLNNEVSGPAGTATYSVDDKGESYKFKNAQGEEFDVDDPTTLGTPEEQDLAAASAIMATNAVKGTLQGTQGIAGGLLEHMGKALNVTDKARLKLANEGGVGGLAAAFGVASAGISLSQAIQEKDAAAQLSAGLQLAGSGLELGSAASAGFKALASTSKFLGAGGGVLGGLGTVAAGLGTLSQGQEFGLPGKVAQGAVDITAGVLGIGAALAGTPIVGALIGAGGFFVNTIIELATDSPHQIGDLQIDEDQVNFTDTPKPATPEDVQKQEELEQETEDRKRQSLYYTGF